MQIAKCKVKNERWNDGIMKKMLRVTSCGLRVIKFKEQGKRLKDKGHEKQKRQYAVSTDQELQNAKCKMKNAKRKMALRYVLRCCGFEVLRYDAAVINVAND
jgi:hypothetical protein